MPAVARAVRFLCRDPWLLTVLLLYFALYGAMLVATGGLPYVMDNNESFSSLWHAENMYRDGLGKSFGLADESFSPHPEAHPYVHSHQGNFPRLFAFLIYVLGAKTVEWQIVITTLTVGAAAIALMYANFARIGTRMFAAIVCAVFMTDYMLFAQWHVVTWRVWHSVLFFGCFYVTGKAIEREAKARWLVILAAAFCCLFYYELVFSAFVAALCGIYVLVRCRTDWRKILKVGTVQVAGAVLGLGIVFGQAIGYLGLQDFLRDIRLTFLARNDASSVAASIDEANRFYADKKVIFWHNLQDRAEFSGLLDALRSFTAFDWRIHSPLLAVTTWILATGWLLSLIPETNLAKRRLLAILVAIGWAIGALFLIPSISYELFDGSYQPVWDALHQLAGPHAVGTLAFAAAIAVSAYLIAHGAEEVLGERSHRLTQVAEYLLCGALAYAFLFTLSPGYIYAGYLHRHAPFTVFLTDVLVAVALYATLKVCIHLCRRTGRVSREAKPFRLYVISSFAGLASLLLAGIFAFWLAVQWQYIKWLPPDHYSFLKKLDQPPYRGASFVANNYTAPVAAFTQQWAYFDPGIQQAYHVWKGGVAHLYGDTKYLWFADRDTNPEYRRPDYFVCMIWQTPASVLKRLLKERQIGLGELGCSSLPLVILARDPKGGLKGLRLMEYDKTGLENVGTDHWAIVKLDWSSAPGGTVLDWTIKPPEAKIERYR